MRQDEQLARFVREGAPKRFAFFNLAASGSHCARSPVGFLTLLTIRTQSGAQHPAVHEIGPNS